MNLRYIAYILIACVGSLLSGCGSRTSCPEGAICSDEVKTTANGLKYIHHVHFPKNRHPEYLEMMTMHYLLIADTGDTLINTYKIGEVVGQEYLKPAYQGAIEEGFGMMAIGDSMTLYVNVDSLDKDLPKEYQLPLPPNKKDSIKEVRYVIKLYNVQSKAAYAIDEQARQDAKIKREIILQDQKIKKYIESKKLKNIQKHPAGFYYQITRKGQGEPASLGDSVSFTYATFSLPNDILLDKSKGGETVGFVMGKTNVIVAWQYAFAQLAPKGTKIQLYVPSHLAFGSKKNQGIRPFTMLHFDIDVMDIVRKTELSQK